MREVLPQRRRALRFKQEALGCRFDVTLGFYDDGRLGELFMNSAKIGSGTDVMVRDMAIAASLALQFGCPAEVLAGALTRDANGRAEGPLTVALDTYIDKKGDLL